NGVVAPANLGPSFQVLVFQSTSPPSRTVARNLPSGENWIGSSPPFLRVAIKPRSWRDRISMALGALLARYFPSGEIANPDRKALYSPSFAASSLRACAQR